MENNCAVNLALFILNSNYFQYFISSSSANTCFIKTQFDYNLGIFQILPAEIRFENSAFIIYYNFISSLDFLSIHFIFLYYCYNFLFSLIKKLFKYLSLLETIF